MKLKTLLLSTLALVTSLTITSCQQNATPQKIKIYGWEGAPKGGFDTDSLAKQFKHLKENHIQGVFYNTGFDVENTRKAAQAAKAEGVEFYTWVPTMVQRGEGIDSSWYSVSREGFSAVERPAYVGYYTFLCPNREEVYEYLAPKYIALAEIPEVDGIHLDYIRYADVILARGLWDKYGLEMDQEYSPYDYCYCDKCVGDFQELTGVDVRSLGDSAQYNQEWAKFRCDVVTRFVNRLSEDIHKTGKKITAAVFPGPSLSKKMVRQQWDEWNLDIVLPMNYNDFYLEGAEWLEKICRESADSLKGKDMEMYSGLFICGQPEKKAQIKDPEGHGLVPSEMREAVEGSIRGGADAICLFQPGRMTPEHWDAIKDIIEL